MTGTDDRLAGSIRWAVVPYAPRRPFRVYAGVERSPYVVETADRHRLVVYAQNLDTSGAHEALADGQAVRVSWRPQHTFVIDESSLSGGEEPNDA